MVDRIDKVLRRMTSKERKSILDLIEGLKRGHVPQADIKKMQGIDHVYRIRKGSFRIIFQMLNRETIRIIDVERRSDTTYSKY